MKIIRVLGLFCFSVVLFSCSTTAPIKEEKAPIAPSSLENTQKLTNNAESSAIKSSDVPIEQTLVLEPTLYILPKQSFKVDNVSQALDALLSENDGNDNVILYIHGRAGGKKKEPVKSLKSFMPKLKEDYTAKVIMFTWPGSGDGGWKGFPEDRARDAATSLAKTLLALNQYKQINADKLKNTKFTLITHSMGSIVLEEFLNKYYKPGVLKSDLFDTIVLSSSASKSIGHASWLQKLDFGSNLYVSVNDDDKILISAGLFRGMRLGKGLKNETLDPKAIYVDITSAYVNHGYFVSSGQEDNICLEDYYGKILNGEKFDFENSSDCHWRKYKKGGAWVYSLQ